MAEKKQEVRSFFVCERCGRLHQQMMEPEKCSKCDSLFFVWFQNKRESEEYVARFGKT